MALPYWIKNNTWQWIIGTVIAVAAIVVPLVLLKPAVPPDPRVSNLLEKGLPETDHPVIELTRSMEEQIQFFAQDQVSFVGSPQFTHGEQIWLGNHWEDAEPDKVYTVWGSMGEPITPKFRNFDLQQSFTAVKMKVSFTRYRDKPRDLRSMVRHTSGEESLIPKK